MGRRSINTTKSGKYMNPTDQARKEARKKELKKNKKQRQMVRAAVLKGKDPQQLILDLEKIDQMEYNVLQPSPLNEKVLKDKRKKLKDTLDRVLKMYNKDDPDKWAELKRLQVEYDRKRAALFNYYESVKNAQQVQVDDIPLPINALPAELQAVFVGMPSQIPLPAALAPPIVPVGVRSLFPPPPGILKKTTAYPSKTAKKEPPGVPPGPPPRLRDLLEEETAMEVSVPHFESGNVPQKKSIRFADEEMVEDIVTPSEVVKHVDDDNDAEDMIGNIDDVNENLNLAIESDALDDGQAMEEDVNPRPTSLQKRMLAMAGQDIDLFMKEMEEVHKKRRAARAANLEARLQAVDDKERDKPVSAPITGPSVGEPVPDPMSQPPIGLLPGLPPMMFRPPPPRGVPSLLGIRLPPGPPPGLPPRLGIRLPPGPPPGLPPRMLRPPMIPPTIPPTLVNAAAVAPLPAQSNVLSAAPQLISRPEASSTTIQAQAKIRNLSADVTRFLPTALRVKRDDKNKSKTKSSSVQDTKVELIQPQPKPTQPKDDAYKQFMREMEGLL